MNSCISFSPARGEGIFKTVEMTRQMQMEPAKEGPSAGRE